MAARILHNAEHLEDQDHDVAIMDSLNSAFARIIALENMVIEDPTRSVETYTFSSMLNFICFPHSVPAGLNVGFLSALEARHGRRRRTD